MNVAVVGGGPAGSLLAWRLARDGARVAIFDASHPREKPCGGGLTRRALDLLPPSPADDPLPARRVSHCRLESYDGERVEVELEAPVAIAARRELDAWLLRRAVEAGATHHARRVVEVGSDGRLRTADGARHAADVIAGADGAGSLVRRTFRAPIPTERRMMAVGWYAPGDAPMVVRFAPPPLSGYLWLFPRAGHVGVGICAPLAQVPTARLWEELEREAARSFPALLDPDAPRYAHTIPSPAADPASLLEIAGPRWALLGDAAGLADPITGEGIAPALASAAELAATLRDDGSPARYPERVVEGFGRELLRAAALHARFYSPGFTSRMVRYAARSRGIAHVLAELVLGKQGYIGLRRRLLRAGPGLLLDTALAALRGR
jgi:flavin-dependent dehydrogenase